MNGQQLSECHQQYYCQYYGDCGKNSRDEYDLFWDDGVNKDPIATFPCLIPRPLSSSCSVSATESENEERISKSQDSDEDVVFKGNNGSNNSDSCDILGRICLSSFPNRATSSDDASSDDNNSSEELSVLEKIEQFILQTVVEPLSEEPIPTAPELDIEVDVTGFKRKLSFNNLTQARSLTSIIMVASFCYDLLAPPVNFDVDGEDEGVEGTNDTTLRIASPHCHHSCGAQRKTTTTREVYYFYVTYFRDQRECDNAIWDLVRILNLPSRQSLGLVASPRGWFCGSIDVYKAHTNEMKFNGRDLDPHGMAITPSTYDNPYHFNDCDDMYHVGSKKDDVESTNDIRIESDAHCILVIEKEGIYTRLSEDKFFLRYFPCILVTGKGFPDIATRRWVWRMKQILKIPVYGLCDCNPYGVSVLDTYRHYQGVKLGADRSNRIRKKKHRNRKKKLWIEEEEDFFEIEWLGLRPSQIENMDLPAEVFQELTSNDTKRLDSLLVSKSSGSKPFVERGRNQADKLRDLRAMRSYKVELEALHWKGKDYLSQFVYEVVMSHESKDASKEQKTTQYGPPNQPDFMLSDRCYEDDCYDGIYDITDLEVHI